MRLLDYFYSDEGSVYRLYGCAEGSEDTMNMIEGFSLDENGVLVMWLQVSMNPISTIG